MTPLRVSCFVEDDGHRLVIDTLVGRICRDLHVQVEIRFVSSIGGRPKVFSELKRAQVDMTRSLLTLPDILVAAIDGNCDGDAETQKAIKESCGTELSAFLVCAVPDPHVERWLLLDSHAFKEVLGTGCDAPDSKCDKERYKRLLASAVKAASGFRPALGGLEFAEDIVEQMNLEQTLAKDASAGKFISDFRAAVNKSRTSSGGAGPS